MAYSEAKRTFTISFVQCVGETNISEQLWAAAVLLFSLVGMEVRGTKCTEEIFVYIDSTQFMKPTEKVSECISRWCYTDDEAEHSHLRGGLPVSRPD